MNSRGSFRCYLMGTQSLLIHCAQSLLDRRHPIGGLISDALEVRSWALEHDVQLLDPTGDWIEQLRDDPFDYFFSITNFRILPAEVLSLPRSLAINFHDGPLPRYAGLNATAWALMQGEKSHGISWHVMTDELDAGDVLKQRTLEISERETAFSLNVKCYEAGILTFRELIDELASDSVRRRHQDMSQRSLFAASARPQAAGTLLWNKPAAELEALVRGLDYGPYPNPLGLPKMLCLPKMHVDDQLLVVHKARRAEGGGAPGMVVGRNGRDQALRVATADGVLEITEVRSIDGEPVELASLVIEAGAQLPISSDAEVASLNELNRRAANNESFWLGRLLEDQPLSLPYPERTGQREPAQLKVEAEADAPTCSLASMVAYLSRLCDRESFSLGYHLNPQDLVDSGSAEHTHYFTSILPMQLSLDFKDSLSAATQRVTEEIARLRKRALLASDLWARTPGLQHGYRSICVAEVSDAEAVDAFVLPLQTSLALVTSSDGQHSAWHYDRGSVSDATVESMRRQYAAFRKASTDARDARPLGELPLMSPAETERVLHAWNQTEASVPQEDLVHSGFEARAAEDPDAVAIVSRGKKLSYRELDLRANRLARRLESLGIGPDQLVGVCLERGADLLVAVLAVLKSGGAYLPLDPRYPQQRLAFMLQDSGAPLLITQQQLLSTLPANGHQTICVDRDQSDIEGESAEPLGHRLSAQTLAYVIYTSGSTGTPKGVMVEHRNVVGFMAAMDAHVKYGDSRVWLAVTSLSFDISVLELLWTLNRGFTVVLHSDRAYESSSASQNARSARAISFSLMYFASDEGANASDKYHLLLEGAKFADTHGFEAVWTPERHFHAFGGLYPNPSVASAALATITERVKLRAGSCVLPLHHPIRVAEEWALVDNLSGGRVGISFASGWQPNDFVLNPEAFAERKESMFDGIETVRSLWRGESISMRSPTGDQVEVRTLPRPVQAELPVWVTAAGNPETFRRAGEIGANVLTHLLGQSVAEVSEKIETFRQAWRQAGHSGRGRVTLMLHTLVGDDEAAIRELVRQPMKDYLRSAVGLIKEAAWTFPTFQQRASATGKTPAELLESETLTEDDMEALLEYSFERYYGTSGLFGTPESCMAMVERLREAGVDEIACLLDYGVASAIVLEQLPQLGTLASRAAAATAARAKEQEDTLAELVAKHGVTHLQCTPSQMRMLLEDEAAVAALSTMRQILVGGEAFPPEVARQLTSRTSAEVVNMYGPTETTIWSAVHSLDSSLDSLDSPDTLDALDALDALDGGSVVPIGRPIANTRLYVLDRLRQPCPVGVPGELYIGGLGVVRGYLGREQLTAERFLKSPFVEGERMYRTGDRVRHRADGVLEFLGRIDNQVKVRGFRIELGEIETTVNQHQKVKEAVVVAKGDRLVGYIVPRGKAPTAAELKEHLSTRLPEYMVPSSFTMLSAMPLTPNGKLDRHALPEPGSAPRTDDANFEAPATAGEALLAEVWAEALAVEQISALDNFFDLGGHSLLAMAVIARVRRKTEVNLSPVDLGTLSLRQLAAQLEPAIVAPELGAPSGSAEPATAAEPERPLARPFLHKVVERLGLRAPKN